MVTSPFTDRDVEVPTPVPGLGNSHYLDLIRLTPLLERILGRPEIKIGLVDGPVALDHPDLATENIREVPGEDPGTCALSSSVVAAAGNQGVVGSSSITRHPWVIPVAACNREGRPLNQSNLGNSIGRHGVLGPGDNVTSLGSAGEPLTLGGTSVAAPSVTGTLALLWSEFPRAPACDLLLAVRGARGPRRMALVPPLLDAWSAHEFMVSR
jgi:subtilisin family serine protease